MLEVRNVSKKYRYKTVLQHVNFTIQSGEIVGIVGRNGAGKTTLLHIVATLLKQDEGVVLWNGMDHVKTLRKEIGFVPQELAIFEDLTVQENMQFFEQLSPVRRNVDELEMLCQQMALHAWQESVSKLSGGMKRKLNLAISLIHRPSLLLLDEPTVGIDLKSKLEIATALQTLAQNGATILYISHDMDEILNLCTRILSVGDDDFYANLLAGKIPIDNV